MIWCVIIIFIFHCVMSSDVTTEDIQFLNDLPLDKLLRLKTSLRDFTTEDYGNVTTTTPSYLNFGAEAMAIRGPPIKRTDYEEAVYKKESKITNLFSMSVTTLAFLAFGGYLLCLIVQAVKAKQQYNNNLQPTQPTTFFVSAGLKKKPQHQFASYGRREERLKRSLSNIDLPPEQLLEALLQLCEGYAKWDERYENIGG